MDKRIDSHRRPWGVSAAAAGGVLALHLAVLSAVSLGASTGKPPLPRGGSSGIETPSPNDSTTSMLVFIDRTVLAADHGPAAPALRVRPPKLEDLPLVRLVRLSAVDLGPSGAEESSEARKTTATTAVDGAEQAMLFGRYVDQIVARIERAWVRPQSAPSGTSSWGAVAMGAFGDSHGPASSPLFRCRVQVLQSRDGAVLEVTLLDCDGNPEWQQSLVNAIDAASPLPAPPSESVFARSLVLSFTSAAQIR